MQNRNFKTIEIKTSQICFEERVKLKCFQCNKYNHKWTCPPKIPKLDYETIIKKYSSNGPKIVFSNDDTTINVAVSLTDNKMSNMQIKSFKEIMEKTFEKNSEIITSDLYEVDNHNVGKIKIISQAQDTSIYNNMIFFSYNDKLVIVTFNCITELQSEWQDVGDFIIDSLFFKE